MGKRITGRAGQAALKRRRALHPFCAKCAEKGIVRAADEMDHILCLALGGEDVDENIQGLCRVCHVVKTALEEASTGGANNHPDWLRPSRCRLTIVTGPPCAGKSTLVERERDDRDLVIDLDDLAENLSPGFNPARRWTSELLNQSIRARNALLGSLSQLPPNARAWFVVSAPTQAERVWWAEKLKPEKLLHLDPGDLVCLERAKRRGPGRTLPVHEWYALARGPWSVEKRAPRRVAIGADGYPLDDGSK